MNVRWFGPETRVNPAGGVGVGAAPAPSYVRMERIRVSPSLMPAGAVTVVFVRTEKVVVECDL